MTGIAKESLVPGNNSLLATVRHHWTAFIFAVFVAAIIAFPQVIAVYRMGSLYQGIRPLVSDEIYYFARMHETFDGHPTLGNPYLAEYKATPGVQFWLGDTALAHVDEFLFGTTFNTLQRGNIFWDFLLPFFDFLASYAILYALTRRRAMSITLSLFLILGLFFIPFSRTPYPQLICLFFAAVYAVIKMEGKRWRSWALIASVFGGLLFYIYPFFWTYWIVFIVLAIGLSWFFDTSRENYWRYGLVFIGTLLLGIPYFLESYAAEKLPYYTESLMRIGAIQTHFPSGFAVVTVAVFTFLLFIFVWQKKFFSHISLAILALSGSLAGAVVMNQHVITGLNYEFVVHYTLPAICMSIFALAFVVSEILSSPQTVHFARQARYITILGGFVILVYTGIALIPQIVMVATPQPSDIAAQRYSPILQWLDTHTNIDDVVYADTDFSLYVPAYTRDNVFFSNYVFETYLPQSEVDTRYIGSQYLNGPLTQAEVTASEGEVFGPYYEEEWQHTLMINKVRRLFGLQALLVERYPEQKIAQLIKQETFAQKGSFESALSGYQVNYFVWDTIKDPSWNLTRVPGLKKLYEANGIIVYLYTTPHEF